MAKQNYYDFIKGAHNLYTRYVNDWKLAVKSYYGGVEYRSGEYLKAYDIDFSTNSDVINTYDVDDDGNQIAAYRSWVEPVNTKQEANSEGSLNSFYQEKLQNVPVLPYTRLYVSEWNAILWRSPPVRELPDTPEIRYFETNVDGEGNSINEFMSQVDTYTSIYGVVWVSCIKPAGALYPRWRWHSPLDVTNWQYGYNLDGDLELTKLVVRVTTEPEVEIYQYFTKDTIETIFMPMDDADDMDFELPDGAEFVEGTEDDDKGFYRIVQPNELGYIPVRPVYQSSKIYNGIGHTPIFDIAQLQRSIYGDYGEIYSSISYGSHPVTIVDETTLAQNGFNVGAEPGSVINVQNSLNGQPSYVFEFKAPPLDSIKELRELVEQKIEKMNQVAMIRSDELIKASRSGVQIEQYDSKLEAFIRKKAVSLENLEAHQLWPMWFDWQGQAVPEDLTISYNRLYSQKGLENELREMDMLITAYERFTGAFGAQVEYEAETYETQAEAEAKAAELGGTGFHTHTREDGVTIYMPFNTHEEYEMRVEMATGLDAEETNYKEEIRDKIRTRLEQLIDGSYSENSL